MPRLIDEAEYKRLASLLAEVRDEVGLTQTELGARLGKRQKFVSVIETGVRRIDFLELLAFERALGLPQLSLVRRVVRVLKDA
jgi:HTH-type transcriptional regulator/antitoxin HipB